MGNILRRVDILGKEFEINFGRSRRIQTTIGGTLTFISLIMIIVASINFIFNYLDTTNAEVSLSKEFDPNCPRISIIDSKMSPVIRFLQNSINFLDPKKSGKYFTIQGMILQINYESLQNFKMEMKPLAQIPFKPCSEISSNKTKWYLDSAMGNAKNFSEFNGFCAEVENPELFFIEGNIVSPPQTVFVINVYPCSLENKEECATPEELFQLNMYISLPKFSFNQENFDNPATITPSVGLTTPLNYGSMKKREIWLKKYAVYDDRIDFAGETLNSEYFEIDDIEKTTIPRMGMPVHCTIEQIMMSQCQPYVILQLASSGKFVKVKRSYKKLLNVLGEIGGAAKMFFIIISVVFYLLGNFLIKKKKAKVILGVEVGEAKTLIGKDISDEKSKKNKFWKIFKEFQVQNHNGYEIIKNLNKFRVLDEVLFEDYHRKLVPLLILNKLKKILKNKNKEKKELTVEEALKKLSQEEPDPLKEKMRIFFLNHLPKELTKEITGDTENHIEFNGMEALRNRRIKNSKTKEKKKKGKKRDREMVDVFGVADLSLNSYLKKGTGHDSSPVRRKKREF